MPADQPTRRRLNRKDFLRSDSSLVSEPLPDHPLRDADLVSKRGLSNSVSLEVGRKLHSPILATLVSKVNSKLLDRRIKRGHVPAMHSAKRPKPGDGVPKEVMKAEGMALAALWKARKHRTQEEFAQELGFGQGNFSHYVGGRRPIPLDVGLAVAKELSCALGDFSPRLAEEFAKGDNKRLAEWPFAELPPERISKLSPGQMRQIEGVLMEELERIEARAIEAQKAARTTKRRGAK
jgi:transcriptional regulator with XRE-family HTH domain